MAAYDPEIPQVLLSQVKNIDINHLNLPDEDDNENTPLLLAAKRGNIEILTIFSRESDSTMANVVRLSVIKQNPPTA